MAIGSAVWRWREAGRHHSSEISQGDRMAEKPLILGTVLA